MNGKGVGRVGDGATVELELWARAKENVLADGRQTLDSLPRPKRTRAQGGGLPLCVCLENVKNASRAFLCLARKFNPESKLNWWKKAILLNFCPCCCCHVSCHRDIGLARGICSWPLPHGRLPRYNSLIPLRPCPSPTSVWHSRRTLPLCACGCRRFFANGPKQQATLRETIHYPPSFFHESIISNPDIERLTVIISDGTGKRLSQ